jgi:hypothetical protein
MRGRVGRGLLVSALLGAGLVACGGVSDNEAGGPIPHQLDGETYPGDRVPVSGAVELASNGCLFLVSDGVRHLAVWPAGAAQDRDDATVVRLADGTRVKPKDSVTASGLLFPVTGLVGYPDGYWGSQVTFCVPHDSTVLVLDTVEVVHPA